ncbi:MAG: hypothetical protein AB7V56_16720 [Candidatus Nitrosocosmicus sp.]
MSKDEISNSSRSIIVKKVFRFRLICPALDLFVKSLEMNLMKSAYSRTIIIPRENAFVDTRCDVGKSSSMATN